MTDKAKYILFSLLDFALTFGGSIAVIVINYIDETNPLGYKLSLTGVLLVIALLLTAKAIFERQYRNKYDTLLQQLAEATESEVKTAISNKIKELKTKNNIYQRMMLLLPFAILFLVTFLGINSLQRLQASVGLILVSMGSGSVFNIIKKPIAEKVSLEKIKKSIE